ncbi:MAG: mechanosensitive ion channel family protein, partial [Cyclobacteriaceae bacterium]
VGFRSTRIRTFSNSLVTVPNGRLSDLTIDNHGLRVFRRFRTHFGITYDTPPEVIDTFVQGLKKIVQQHSQTRKDYYEIHLHQMGETSLNVLFYIFFEVPDWSQELTARHEILLEVIRWAEEIGIRFAFPTQTLHMETYPGQLPLTPTFDSSMEELKAKLTSYFDGKSGDNR